MKKSFAIVLGLVLISSCAETTKEVEVQDVQKEVSSENEAITVVPNHVMTMEISGMSCEMACGGSIREGLVETGAVSRVQYIDFDMDNETNVAKVYFDDSKITEEKIVEIVSALNKKQFTVGKRRVDAFTEPTSSVEYIETSSSKKSTSTPTSMASTAIELPNLFDLLRSIIRH